MICTHLKYSGRRVRRCVTSATTSSSFPPGPAVRLDCTCATTAAGRSGALTQTSQRPSEGSSSMSLREGGRGWPARIACIKLQCTREVCALECCEPWEGRSLNGAAEAKGPAQDERSKAAVLRLAEVRAWCVQSHARGAHSHVCAGGHKHMGTSVRACTCVGCAATQLSAPSVHCTHNAICEEKHLCVQASMGIHMTTSTRKRAQELVSILPYIAGCGSMRMCTRMHVSVQLGQCLQKEWQANLSLMHDAIHLVWTEYLTFTVSLTAVLTRSSWALGASRTSARTCLPACSSFATTRLPTPPVAPAGHRRGAISYGWHIAGN